MCVCQKMKHSLTLPHEVTCFIFSRRVVFILHPSLAGLLTKDDCDLISVPPVTNVSDSHSFKERIQKLDSAPGEVLVLPASISNVVSFYASFSTVPDFEKGEDLLRDLVISMLDKGTIHKTKLEIAALIEDVGARVSFSGNRIRSSVSGKVLVVP